MTESGRSLSRSQYPSGAQVSSWRCEHSPRCADAGCSYNPAIQKWIAGAAVSTCRHGRPEDDCPFCSACDACDGSCGACPYVGERQ